MEFTEVFKELREYARIIRNEKTTSANTALRIGDMYLSIIDAMEQVSKGNDLFSLRTDDNGSQYIHTPYALASDSTLSSLGVGSSEGGGVSYNRLDSWDSYTADKAGYVLSAALGWDLKTRLDNLDLGDFDLSGYLTKSEAQNTYATIESLNSYATKTWVSDNYINKDTSSIYIQKVENNVYKGGLLLGSTRVVGLTPYESESWILDNATGNATFNGHVTIKNGLICYDGSNLYARIHKSSSAFANDLSVFDGDTDTGFLRVSLNKDEIATYTGYGSTKTSYIKVSSGEASFKSLKVNDVTIGSLAFKNNLVASDIPSLSWSKITSDKPTTLSGYGITNAYTKTEADDRYLKLSGGTINGALTVVGSARFNNDVWFDIDASADYLYARTDLSVGDNSLTDPNIYMTKDSFKIYPLGQESSENFSLTYELIPQANIYKYKLSNGVITLAFEDTYIGVDGLLQAEYLESEGISIWSDDFEHEISYIGNSGTSWIGTDLWVQGNLAVEDAISIGDGDAKIWWDATNKVLRTNVSFASDKTISSLGVGSESGGGGTGGYASLDNVASDVIPSASNTFTIGNSSRLWKAVYANSLYLGTTNVGESISSLQSGLSTANGNIGTLNTRVINIEGGYAKKATTLDGYGLQESLEDLNYPTPNTFFKTSDNTPQNAPVSAWGVGFTLAYNNDWAYQTQLFLSRGHIYTRQEYGSVWSEWNTLLDSSNFSDYALPLSGGTITINSYQGITIKRDASNAGGLLWFANNGGNLGAIGFNANKECYIDTGSAEHTLIHNGNIGSQSVNYANSAGNSDMLGNFAASCFLRSLTRTNVGTSPNFDNPTSPMIFFERRSNDETPNQIGTPPPANFVGVLSLRTADNIAMIQLAGSNYQGWYIRGKQADGVTLEGTKWQQIATIDSNVASATKLATARTIWGQSFDGSGDVSGNIYLDNNILYGNGYKNALDLTGGGLNIGYGYRKDTNIHYWGNAHAFVIGENYAFLINSSGNVTIGSSDLAGSIYKLYVNGDSYVNGSLTVSEDTSLSSSLTVQGKTELESGLDVIGLIQGLDSVGGDTTWKITSDGSATFGSTLKVTGTTTLEDKLTISKNGMSVTGTAYFGGGTTYYFGSSGNVSANTLTAEGATSLKSTLAVTGASTFTGKTTHNGGLGATSGTFSTTLGVTGATSLKSTLSVAGATTLSSTLGVTGVATFNSSIKAKGYIYFGDNKDAYIYWDAGKKVLRTNVSFASDKTVSSLGVGTESGGGGSADWGAVPTDILPMSDDYYNIGSPSLRFSEGHFNNVYADAVEVGSCTIYSNGNASFDSLSIGGADAATQTWVNTRLASYISKEGGSVSGTLTAGTAIYTGEKTAAWDGKSGAAIMASGNLVLVGTNPHIYFGYGNATTSTSSLEAIDDGGFRIVYNMEVFTSTVNKKNHIQLNYGNTRIYRLNNDSSGMQFQYGTSASSVSTKGTFSTSGAYSASSDITKKNILSYNAGFNVHNIAEAPIAYFTWKDLTDNRVNLGSIAQYWQLIAPECIYGTEGIDMTMDYSTLGLVSSIINARAIVSHENEIDKLKRRVEELESENKRLQERVDALVA